MWRRRHSERHNANWCGSVANGAWVARAGRLLPSISSVIAERLASSRLFCYVVPWFPSLHPCCLTVRGTLPSQHFPTCLQLFRHLYMAFLRVPPILHCLLAVFVVRTDCAYYLFLFCAAMVTKTSGAGLLRATPGYLLCVGGGTLLDAGASTETACLPYISGAAPLHQPYRCTCHLLGGSFTGRYLSRWCSACPWAFRWAVGFAHT